MINTLNTASNNVVAVAMSIGLIFYLVVMLAAAVVSFFGGIAKGFLLAKYPDHEPKDTKYSLQ